MNFFIKKKGCLFGIENPETGEIWTYSSSHFKWEERVGDKEEDLWIGVFHQSGEPVIIKKVDRIVYEDDSVNYSKASIFQLLDNFIEQLALRLL